MLDFPPQLKGVSLLDIVKTPNPQPALVCRKANLVPFDPMVFLYAFFDSLEEAGHLFVEKFDHLKGERVNSH